LFLPNVETRRKGQAQTKKAQAKRKEREKGCQMNKGKADFQLRALFAQQEIEIAWEECCVRWKLGSIIHSRAS
jgi:hypothetical protein